MYIQSSDCVPDDTYFRTGDAEPIVDDSAIVMFNGRGSSRSWGSPQITSTIILSEPDFAAIHFGFSHKHGGGQAWRYFMADGTTIQPVRWSSLPDALRQRVLDAYEENAPTWANRPGKLKSQYSKPTTKTHRTYKLVSTDQSGRLWSLYDGSEYQRGIRRTEVARDHHGGGFYSHPSVEQVKRLWEQGLLVPERCYTEPKTLALVECEASGTVIRYPNGKLSSTYLRVVDVVETFDYTPETPVVS